MKLIIMLVLSLISVSALAQDLAESHAQICEDSKDPCRVVFSINPKALSGVCTGKLKNETLCTITYVVGASSAVKVMCGIQNEIMMAQGHSYNVSALVGSGENEFLMKDPTLYTSIEAKSLRMFMAQNGTSVAAQILIKDKNSASLLTEVKCY